MVFNRKYAVRLIDQARSRLQMMSSADISLPQALNTPWRSLNT